MQTWLIDQGGKSFGGAFLVQEELYNQASPFQHIRVIVNADFGRMLILDEAVQTSERDEYFYHEMLTHVPLCTHPDPRTVLIIGGGDGGLLEEVLKHPVDKVTMVEIDPTVVEVSRRYLPGISANAFDDPRTVLVFGDGARFVQETQERFDVVLVDSTDPKGPAVNLFAAEFYVAIAQKLTPQGILAVQSGSPLYQQKVIRMVRRNMGTIFPIVRTYLCPVPTYPGGLWSFTLGSLSRDPLTVPEQEIERRMASIATFYYTPSVHREAFRIPAPIWAELEDNAKVPGEQGG
ncbi:MAG: polyamine aminopropyltransferase [Armatimonadota bacterium]|nr:polyamine aminopropyltransferase [Armatimonadota bacterium]MDR5704065.1 polyamine aminopropyltransferase [Armatimonadota bacterium]MDR7433782.1 polyamine aminopropyltransferase [Armatimonadota bacterium]